MSNNEKFETYKEIKNELKTNYKGYPIEKIIALDLIIKVYHKSNHTLKSLVAFFLKYTFPIYFSTLNIKGLKFNAPNKTLFSMGIYERKDYYEIWSFAQSYVNEKVTFDFSRQKKKTVINFRNIFIAWKIINKTNKLNFKEKFYLAAKLTYYLNIIDDLEKIAPVVGKFCAFSSVHEHEALLTYYFKKNNIPTYSLQHGLYTVYKNNIPLDAILYENFTTDYHLCWGKVTQDEFATQGINKKSLIVAGYSREVERPQLPKKLEKKKCLVLLARYSYHKSNMHLFKILKRMSKEQGIKFHLKLHPSLHWPQFYDQYEDAARENDWTIEPEESTVNGLLEDFKFGWSIAVNTSAYYEAYLKYLPCLRYNDGTYENMVDVMDDVFSDYAELNEKLSTIPFDDQKAMTNYFQKVDESLEYAIGIKLNRYHCLNV